MRILLVEDNPELASRVTRRIKNAGFFIDHVESMENASRVLDDCPYALALLDRRLPDGDGLSLIPRIRSKQPGIRILMLTALDAVDDRIEGLDAGADDYLTKPFNLDEMMARIRASLRRPGAENAPPVKIGSLSFDFGTRLVTINEQPVVFLRRELSLLEVLVGRLGRIVTREALIDAVYGIDDDVQPQALTTLVYRLRSRLQELDSGVDLHVVRGVGYMIAAEKRSMSK